ncbi:ubiquitin-specific protease [Saccharomycopsis crataegensis]|uniref:Ubiquitin carboxyl-terminal hydrolase n=1 Tax=Saccharomycopsis crataegensis TaxID=43959 RepID=A0AAV5QDZ1_9ASCO|nr:ubiquitin-specific protease [Saccharomycopsis crataegensis]
MTTEVSIPSIHPPSPSANVFKDQCLFSFQTPELPGGLNVCLHCYQGFAPLIQSENSNYTFAHYSITGHSLYLNIQKFFQKDVQEEQLQKRLKLDKVQILQENEDDYYKSQYQLLEVDKDSYIPLSIVSNATGYEVLNSNISNNIKSTIAGILSATSMSLKNDIQSWEQEIKPCRHSESLAKFIPENYSLAKHCSSCDVDENLWLCLHCGNIGCGRQQFGGLKGNSHALAHYDQNNDHPVAIKLGSLSLRQQKADCYCYQCNDEVKVPKLAEHLKYFGINVDSFAEQNEKTLTELNIQQNLTWQFNMESDNGELLKPIFGENLVGLKNLGNSCYINSTLQVLCHLKGFAEIFYGKDIFNFDDGALSKPFDDLYLQMIKIFNGLVSNKYSIPNEDSTDSIKWQKGLSLPIFKQLIGKSNAEFASPNQQDAFEFLLFFLDQIESYYCKNVGKYKESSCFKSNPVNALKFVIHNKLSLIGTEKFKALNELNQYLSLNIVDEVDHVDEDGKVHYKPVDINNALESFFKSDEVLELDGKNFAKTSKLASLPDTLLVQIQRAKLVNWIPTKIDVPVVIPDETIDLSKYTITGSQIKLDAQSENLIIDEEDAPETSSSGETFQPNQDVMNSLLQMGFPEPRCVKALYNVSNSSNPEDAMNWLFAHMEDDDIDDPLVIPAGGNSSAQNPNEPTQDEIDNLVVMGFSSKLVRKALILNNKNPEAAVEWLFNNPTDDGEIQADASTTTGAPSSNDQVKSILESDGITDDAEANYFLKAVVCHKGSSIHTGHYVTFVKQMVEGTLQWVLYNDEKVVLANDGKSLHEMKKNGYLYVFVKKGGKDDIN